MSKKTITADQCHELAAAALKEGNHAVADTYIRLADSIRRSLYGY